MKKLYINLPLGSRVGAEPLFSIFQELRRVRRGQKTSRFFRHIFEHKNIRRILGSNLAAIVMASTLIPASSINYFEAEDNIIVQNFQTINTESGVQYPLKKIIFTQGYRLFHPGIDFDGETGDPVYSVAHGTVESVQRSRFAYGNAIIISHNGSGLTSLYAHLSEILVEVGQDVDKNTIIGEVGSTGRSSGSHLHFEIRDGEKTINPNLILPLPSH